MIPKTIHYFWMGGNPKPDSVLCCIESWKKICPDFEIIEWNEDRFLIRGKERDLSSKNFGMEIKTDILN